MFYLELVAVIRAFFPKNMILQVTPIEGRYHALNSVTEWCYYS